MFARHPLEEGRRRLDRLGAAEALRLAIIAELDAINTYLQIAEALKDETVKKVFIDVAREEKTHVGEFLELLRRIDPEQARELEEGAREAAELAGEGGSAEAGPGGRDDPSQATGEGLEEAVSRIFSEELARARLLRAALPVTRPGSALDAAPSVTVGMGEEEVGVLEETLVPLQELVVELLIPRRLVDRTELMGGAALRPLVAAAARRLSQLEERLLLEALSRAKGIQEVSMGAWDRPGEAVEDVARAVAALEAAGARPPYLLVVGSQRYARLLGFSERSGVPDLARVEKLARVVRHPLLGDQEAYLLPLDPAVLDIVVGVEASLEYIGPEARGHRFAARETMALRIQNPAQVARLRTP